ncbi:NADH dehydrogenase [ubiquinone] 1 beta subcomplex subunit 2, mitochondrial-like [Drosophila miranda]|uniref:NADH dehydrogenase [ubiquinone] 1 beta subcomplex subunit 2, mitochondrial-like n=1 Tax=Drosophila miranda TaxID=7229 RepID=UPI0007E87C56|nr:NADH dehydrogenase [ubiquinone] 1 beta subcomplex subunit 2, mitochondrial-like [Drosophila miranda]
MNIVRNFMSYRLAVGYYARNALGNQILKRGSHVVSYRSAPPEHSKATKIGAVVVGGAMWWWVIWHLWHEPDHITGEFDYPNPSKWTNSDLGIPRDDA